MRGLAENHETDDDVSDAHDDPERICSETDSGSRDVATLHG
jgi:hypothetical protein